MDLPELRSRGIGEGTAQDMPCMFARARIFSTKEVTERHLRMPFKKTKKISKNY
jgi:hypothetical protein